MEYNKHQIYVKRTHVTPNHIDYCLVYKCKVSLIDVSINHNFLAGL